jgi:hypothetical protein
LDGQDSGNFTNEPNGANSHLLDPLFALLNQTLHIAPDRAANSSPSSESTWVSNKLGATATFLGRYSPGNIVSQAGEDPYGLLAAGAIRIANFTGPGDTSVDTSWNLIGRGYNLSAILIKSGQGDTLYRVNNGYAWSSNGTFVANVHLLLLSGRGISHVSYFGGPTSSLTPPSEPSRMSIYESAFYIPNGNFSNSGTLDVCAVAYRLSNGSFENKSGGTIIGGDGGNDLVIWINNSFNGNIQNSGAWSGSSVIKWRTDGSNIPQGISGLGPESSSAEMAVEFQ